MCGFWGNPTRSSPLLSKPVRRSNGCAGGTVEFEKRAEKSVREREVERKALVEERERREEREFLKFIFGV